MAYGARCVWWDDKARSGTKASGLPCCPHCGGVLFEAEMTTWWSDAHRYQDEGHPGYVPFLRWLQGKCFPTREAAEAAYATHTESDHGRG